MKRVACGIFCVLVAAGAFAQDRQNYFNDPMLQVTSGLPNCPAPVLAGMTEAEMKAATHMRAEQGGSCFRAGRCRLPGSYLYDREIIPRMKVYLTQDDRYANTSIWVLGQRRLVTLMGCVKDEQQSQELEGAVMLVDDVAGVINELMVGTEGQPRYNTAHNKP